MTLAEAIETTRIHRVAGLTGDRTALVTTRPFRAPHQTISDAGLIGGGHVPMPGEVSLAYNGVLFLDERPECRRHVLEGLRQPLRWSPRAAHPRRDGPRRSRCERLAIPLLPLRSSSAFRLIPGQVWLTDTPSNISLNQVAILCDVHRGLPLEQGGATHLPLQETPPVDENILSHVLPVYQRLERHRPC